MWLKKLHSQLGCSGGPRLFPIDLTLIVLSVLKAPKTENVTWHESHSPSLLKDVLREYLAQSVQKKYFYHNGKLNISALSKKYLP